MLFPTHSLAFVHGSAVATVFALPWRRALISQVRGIWSAIIKGIDQWQIKNGKQKRPAAVAREAAIEDALYADVSLEVAEQSAQRRFGNDLPVEVDLKEVAIKRWKKNQSPVRSLSQALCTCAGPASALHAFPCSYLMTARLCAQVFILAFLLDPSHAVAEDKYRPPYSRVETEDLAQVTDFLVKIIGDTAVREEFNRFIIHGFGKDALFMQDVCMTVGAPLLLCSH